ncbi:MAG: glycosyltransferase family 2 protein [Arenimonas sp.]
MKMSSMENTDYDSSRRQPLVSVGIPTFNRPEGLSRALECIQKQTYKNIEIIVSDNCSPGEAVNALMHSLANNDRRIRYFRQKSNIGATANFEFVLHESTGKYFFWAADDDLCDATFIQQIVEAMEENPEVVLCACDVKNIDDYDNLLEISKLESIRISKDWKKARRAFFQYPSPNIYHCIYGIFKAEALKECGLQHTNGWNGIAIYTEGVFLARFSQWGRIVSIAEDLKSFRVHQASETSAAHKKMLIFDEVMLHLLNRIRLCSIALTTDCSWTSKLSLLWAVFISMLKNLKPPKFIVYSIPKRFRVWLKQNVLTFLR